MVTEVYPVALTVNVAAPVPELFAVIVTFCGDAKSDGVKVSDPPPVTDRPLLPEVNDVATVTFAAGAADSEIPTVPVPPCATDSADAPVPSEPFQLAFVTVTFFPDCDQFPFHPWASCWLPE